MELVRVERWVEGTQRGSRGGLRARCMRRFGPRCTVAMRQMSHVYFHPCREEQVFAREEVVGRDASSVFPTETRQAEVDARAQAFKALFGDNRRFVTETEVGSVLLVCGEALAGVQEGQGRGDAWPGRECRPPLLGREVRHGHKSSMPAVQPAARRPGAWPLFSAVLHPPLPPWPTTQLREFEDAAHKRSTPEDAGPSRPLAEILQEAKEAKDQKFKDAWKQMKIVRRRCEGLGVGVCVCVW